MQARPGKILLCFLLLNFFIGAGAEAQTQLRGPALEPIRLDQAVETALKNNPLIQNGRIDVEISRERMLAARSHLFPTMRVSALGLQLLSPLEFDFKKGVFGNFPATGPIPDENTNVTTDMKPLLLVNAAVVQPILQLGRINLAVKQSEFSRSIAQEKLRALRQQTVNQIRRAYYKALELQESFRVIEATKMLYVEIDRVTDERLKEMTVLPAESLEVKQQLASNELESVRLNNLLETQKEEINHLLGRDTRSGFALVNVEEPPPLTFDLAAAQSRALAARSELKQLGWQSKQIELERRVKKLQYLPDLSLVVDYLSVFGAQILPRNIVFTGLVLNWEPIDWGRKKHEIAEQRKLLQQSRNSQSDTQAQILQDASSSFRRFQESRQMMTVSQLGKNLAAERLRVATEKYRERSVLLREVLQAQRDLTQANNQYTQAVLSFWTARADLEKALGED